MGCSSVAVILLCLHNHLVSANFDQDWNEFGKTSFLKWTSNYGFNDPTSYTSAAEKNGDGNSMSVISGLQYRPGPWSECSSTCGPGIKTRTVDCVAQQGITANIVRLQDLECAAMNKPSMFEPCEQQPCSLSEEQASNAVGKGPFRWDYGEWGPCSASCLGGQSFWFGESSNLGKQKSTLKCLDLGRNQAVPWSNCRAKQRPVDLTRSCNSKACPPTWESIDFGPCSHSCGGGIRSRKVRCTRRVSLGSTPESVLILPDAQCTLPKPVDQEACALIDCPFSWRVEDWTPCSKTCGRGEQYRTVVCERRDASGIVHSYNPPLACMVDCASLTSPLKFSPLQASDMMNDNAMPTRYLSRFEADRKSSSYDQSHPEHHRLTLNVGGFANIYEGTSIKVKCPVKNFEKKMMYWTKDGKRIRNSAHIKVSANGALRIFHANMSDTGIYTCFAGSAQGNVTLKFKHRSDFSTEGRELPTDHDIDVKTPNDVDELLLKKVRDSLNKLGERNAYEKVKSIKEPGRLALEYVTGDWSLCTQKSCSDVEGTQVRSLRCRLNVDGLLAYVEDEVCDSFSVQRPQATQACRADNCPTWDVSDWSECSPVRCTRDGISIARREVKCVYPNSTIAEPSECERKTRPKLKKECQNLNCTAEWKSSVWGKCSKKCDDGGVQMRILRCVWKGSRRAAGSNCDPSQRPAAIRACATPNLPPCISSDGRQMDAPQRTAESLKLTCIDQSRFCDVLRVFHS